MIVLRCAAAAAAAVHACRSALLATAHAGRAGRQMRGFYYKSGLLRPTTPGPRGLRPRTPTSLFAAASLTAGLVIWLS